MASREDQYKLDRLIRKGRAEERQQIVVCRRAENILQERLNEFLFIEKTIEEELRQLKLLEDELSVAHFIDGQGVGISDLERRRAIKKRKMKSLEYKRSELKEGIDRAERYLSLAKQELHQLHTSRKTAEQLSDRRRIASIVLIDQEEEGRIEDNHRAGNDRVYRRKLKKDSF
ncbi:MAG TPA: hypothetical protein PKA63_00320 [Oligoflexia bacterium]|nr:hypothetical protein [Oligoflexia bacterium]HMP47093.1 hypothetical protein [Oligoflexia bacterium]